jgi:hypothetical protein
MEADGGSVIIKVSVVVAADFMVSENENGA